MILTEKVKFNGIQKDISPSAIQEGGDRKVLNPVIDAFNARYFTSEHSDGYIVESIKGNTQIVNATLDAYSGTTKCIGSYEDKQNNLVIFFIYNSVGNHSIFKYDPILGVITLIIKNSLLNFQDNPKYLITGVGSINDLLYFTDGYQNQRVLNITRDYSYVPFNILDITLIKRQPQYAPTTVAHYDERVPTTNVVNTIADNSYQFSYRYIYLDGEVSNFAPPSVMNIAEKWPDIQNVSKGKTSVTTPSESRYRFVSKIEFLYRVGNIGTWKVFKISTVTSLLNAYTADFTGTEFIYEVAESESSKVSESIPNFSKALAIQKNRLFLSDDESGFEAPGTIAITPNITSEFIDLRKTYWKKGGKKKIGIALWDAEGRTVGVTFPTEFSIPAFQDTNKGFVKSAITYAKNTHTLSVGVKTFLVERDFINFKTVGTDTGIAIGSDVLVTTPSGGSMAGEITSINYTTLQISITISSVISGSGSYSNWTIWWRRASNSNIAQIGYKLGVSITGSLAAGFKARSFSLAVSDDLTYDEYVQVAALVHLYRYDGTSLPSSPSSFKYNSSEAIFLFQAGSEEKNYSRVYLRIPRETAAVIDDSWYVRILAAPENSLQNQPDSYALQKVEKVISVIDGEFIVVNNFGIQDWYDGFVGPFYIEILIELFKPKESNTITRYREITERYGINVDGTLGVPSFSNLPGDTYTYWHRMSYTGRKKVSSSGSSVVLPQRYAYEVESPTPTTLKTDLSQFTKYDEVSAAKKQYTPDYSKKAITRGISLVEVEDNKRLFVSKTQTRFSNKFIQDSFVNGLSSFDFGNKHSISSERGDIKKYVPIGSGNILAVHERACTTLYIEEGIITTADGQESLSITKNVIGHDRKLMYDYGSYHAESIQEHEGMAFGFDIYKGIVWRYTNAGQFPISNLGMQSYFRALAQEYLPIKDTCKIVGGIDPFNKEYIITFKKADGSGVTWAFNYAEERWIGRYSFIPEMYAKIGTEMYSFNNGKLWKHNVNSVHCNFYGSQSNRFIKIAVNPIPGKKKVFNGIQIYAPLLSDNQAAIVAEFRCGSQYSWSRLQDFDIKQGIHFGPIRRDANTVNVESPKIPVLDGDDLRGDYVEVTLTTYLPERLPIQCFNITYNISEFSK